MNKSEAQQFLSNMYQDIVSEMNTEKIADYFSEDYVQVTDGSHIDLVQFKDHIRTLKNVARTITVSPFHEFLFDERLESAKQSDIRSRLSKRMETGGELISSRFLK
nr:hypothetical protein [Bacillus licheniformis]